MAIKVDKQQARQKLLDAYNHRNLLTDDLGKKIEKIIKGTHKTYRYVLVTALISKATNGEIDPLSLQAQDDSLGAYDARSIAHGVLVPFEREYFPKSLGGSNEPYLNKPARFTRLSSSNAVRSGNDKDILDLLISVLSRIQTSTKAFRYLKSALVVMEHISIELNKKYEIELPELEKHKNTQAILDYVWNLSSKSCEGETCAILVATIEKFYNPSNYKVVAHKVNESGSSSKEVGDIDIFDYEENIVNSIEVKDKDFTKEDVEHAITKFREAKLSRSMFVYGKCVSFDKTDVYQVATRYGRVGLYCCVISILDYAKLRFVSIGELTLKQFVREMLQQAREINAKDDTIEWIKQMAKE